MIISPLNAIMYVDGSRHCLRGLHSMSHSPRQDSSGPSVAFPNPPKLRTRSISLILAPSEWFCLDLVPRRPNLGVSQPGCVCIQGLISMTSRAYKDQTTSVSRSSLAQNQHHSPSFQTFKPSRSLSTPDLSSFVGHSPPTTCLNSSLSWRSSLERMPASWTCLLSWTCPSAPRST